MQASKQSKFADFTLLFLLRLFVIECCNSVRNPKKQSNQIMKTKTTAPRKKSKRQHSHRRRSRKPDCPDKHLDKLMKDTKTTNFHQKYNRQKPSQLLKVNSMCRTTFTSLFSIILPESMRHSFVSYIKQSPAPSHLPEHQKIYRSISKDILLEAFLKCRPSNSSDQLSVRECEPVEMITNPLDYYLIECVLNRSTKESSTSMNDYQFASPVIHARCNDSRLYDKKFDNLYRTIVLLMGSSSCFLTCFATKPVKNRKTQITENQLIPLAESWLRLQRSNGLPSKGSYIKKICKVWAVSIKNESKVQVCQIIRAHQFDDEFKYSPIIPPDCYRFCNGPPVHSTLSEQRSHYQALLLQSPTIGVGRRKYVKGTYHRILPDSCLIIDSRIDGNITLDIDNRSPDRCKRVGRSCIHIRDARHHRNLCQLLSDNSRRLRPTFGKTNARAHSGDKGGMYSVGTRVSQDGSSFGLTKITNRLYSSTAPNIASISTAASRMAEEEFPQILHAMKQIERVANLSAHSLMGGDKSPSIAASISVDLCNATHYDVNDCSYSFSIWSEDIPGSAKNWFFILPNALVRHNDRTYNGIAIRLFHGAAIAWDGRIHRHGTTATDPGCGNHVYGWFWGASRRAIDYENKENS